MSVRVYIPTPFRRATHNRDTIESKSPDVRRLLDELEATFDGLRGLLRNDAGEVHHHINIYVNSEAIETQQGLDTPLNDGDEVAIIPALAGGAGAAVRAERHEPCEAQPSWGSGPSHGPETKVASAERREPSRRIREERSVRCEPAARRVPN